MMRAELAKCFGPTQHSLRGPSRARPPRIGSTASYLVPPAESASSAPGVGVRGALVVVAASHWRMAAGLTKNLHARLDDIGLVSHFVTHAPLSHNQSRAYVFPVGTCMNMGVPFTGSVFSAHGATLLHNNHSSMGESPNTNTNLARHTHTP
jgi:hypothetical protein